MNSITHTSAQVRRSLWAIPALIALLFAAACDSDNPNAEGGVALSSSPLIVLSPSSFLFSAAPVGSEEQRREVTISNNGEADLQLVDFEANFKNSASYVLDYTRSNSEGVVIGIDPNDDQDNLSGQRLTIAPNESLTFILKYTPDEEGAGNSLTFKSNDPEAREVLIPIEGGDIASELIVTPGNLDFGRVAAGEVQRRDITITNVGAAPANIASLSINGSPDFRVVMGDEEMDPIANRNLLSDPDRDNSPGLAAQGSFTMTVIYEPPMEGPDEAALNIMEASGAQISVPLSANGASPCLNLVFPDSNTPNADELNFGPTLVDMTRNQTVVVESCGGEPLSISAIRVEGEQFGLGGNLPETYPAVIPPITNGTIATNSFSVTFTPPELDFYEGTLIIESNDPINPTLEVPLTGRGSVNACPVAAVAESDLNVQPLDIVVLDAGPSTDSDGPGGLPVSYEWVITSRPAGSTAQPVERFSNPLRPADGGPADDSSTPEALFFVDIAGEYTAELVVTDDQGFSAPSAECPQSIASVYINARPEGAILVELTWQTPADQNETDLDGTDVDLHLLHFRAGAGWTTSEDCYYGNPNDDWGPAGLEGNPSLDIDDTNGAGPENISIDTPENTGGSYYRVGVHYYSSGDDFFGMDYGPSDATIRVYLLGLLSGEWTQRLQRTGNFWEVAGIEWGNMTSRVVEINRVYDFTP